MKTLKEQLNLRLYFQSIFVLCFLFYNNKMMSQTYQEVIVNKSPIFATSSVVHDYDEDGDNDIIITRRSGTTDKSVASVELLTNDGTGLFPKQTLFQNLEYPTDIDFGDFNNDGLNDYLVTDENSIVLFINQINGAFTPQVVLDSINFDQSALADFNNDGNLDFISVGFGLDSVNIYLNDGLLNFSSALLKADAIQIDLVEVMDIDKDNDIDIVLGGGASNNFILYYNDGNASFDNSQTLFTTNGDYSSSNGGLLITDLNGDNNLDILTFSGLGSGGLYYLDGTNNFVPTLIDIDHIDIGGDIVTADFDGNGLLDIVRQNYGEDYLLIMYQEEELKFIRDTLENHWDNKGPSQMSTGDLDNDGDIDLIFPENGNVDGDLSWFENIDGKLYRHYLYHEIKSVNLIKSADLDNDSDMDLIVLAGTENTNSAVSENEIVWYENIGNFNFLESRIEDNISTPSDVAIADLNKDGKLDIIAVAKNDNRLNWYQKNGADWISVIIDDEIINPEGIAIADINNDSNEDIVASSSEENKVYGYLNSGSGSFTKFEIDGNIRNPGKIITDDFNNDGNIDIALAAFDSLNSVVYYQNNGNGSYDKTILSMNQFGSAISKADWNDDNNVDIIVSFDKETPLGDVNRDFALFLNDGNGSFTDSTLIKRNERTNVFKLKDINNDNDIDIIFSNLSDLFLAEYESNQLLASSELFDRGVDIHGIEADDFNNDGKIDIIVSDQINSNSNLVLLSKDIGTEIEISKIEKPSKYELYQNYPNPFNPSTTIRYSIPFQSFVSLNIYDILGSQVASLINNEQLQGNYEAEFDGSKLSSGIYFYTLKVNDFIQSRKMMLIK